MARKKVEEELLIIDPAEEFALQAEKEYGNIVKTGDDLLKEQHILIPISPNLDIITAGGIEEPCWVDITGKEKHGKTTLALTIAAHAQKPEYGDRIVGYADVEHRLSIKHLQAIEGLDLSPKKFRLFQSRKGQILTAADFLKACLLFIKTVHNGVLIIDSLSALLHKDLNEKGVGSESRGAGNKTISDFINVATPLVRVNRIVVLAMTHLISNTSGMGAKYVEKVTRRLLYQYDYHLRALSKELIDAGGKNIGLKIKWVCDHCKFRGPPGMSSDSYIRFGVGLDRVYEVMKLAAGIGLIKSTEKGAWFTLSFLEKNEYKHLKNGDTVKIQGDEKLYKLLRAKPEWVDVLEKEVMTLAGVSNEISQ